MAVVVAAAVAAAVVAGAGTVVAVVVAAAVAAAVAAVAVAGEEEGDWTSCLWTAPAKAADKLKVELGKVKLWPKDSVLG